MPQAFAKVFQRLVGESDDDFAARVAAVIAEDTDSQEAPASEEEEEWDY